MAQPGDPLAPGLRQDMESHFGHDFSGVTVHTDAAAAASVRDIRARAYTVGTHVVFGAGRYTPGTRRGRELLAHELAHVVQQQPHTAVEPNQASEAGAAQAARDVAGGAPLSTPLRPTSVGLACAPMSSEMSYEDDTALSLTPKPVEERKPATEMKWGELQDEIDEHTWYNQQQIASTPEVIRREKRIAELEAAQRTLAVRASAPPNRASRKARTKITSALPARPRSLGHSLDLSLLSPAEITAELDRVVAYLAANSPRQEREVLQAELPYLEDAAEAVRAKRIAQQRKESLDIALSPTTGDAASQLTEMLRRVEGAARDPSQEGIWLIHHQGMVFPIDATELATLRTEIARGLVRGASEVNNFLGDVALAWRERDQRNKRHRIVHGLVKFTTGESDISAKSINGMVDVGNFYVRRIKERGSSGRLIQAGEDLLVFDNYARYWSGKVGQWESRLVGGAGRWVLALTIAKEALTILTGYSAAKLASGGGLISTLKTGAKITALTTGTGAVAGGVGAQATGGDWRSGMRAGGGAGFGVGANALTAGAGKIASIGDAAKATTTAGKAYAVGKAVAVEAGANVTTSVTQAAIEGGDKGKAAISALVSSPVSTLGGGAVDTLAKGRAAATVGRTVVGGGAGAASALATDGNILAGTIIGGSGGLYGGLAHTPPAASVTPPAIPEQSPGADVLSAGSAHTPPEGSPPAGAQSAGQRAVGESALLGDNEVDAWRGYQKWRSEDPSREVALIYNHTHKQWAVVQGTRNTVDTIAAAKALGWDPAHTTVSGRHSHPPDASGITSPGDLFPSGRRRDLDMTRSDASKSEDGTQWSAIDVTTQHGADAIYVFYDRKSNTFTVRSPDPTAGPRRYEWHSFPNVEYFHGWYRNRFGHDPSPVPFGAATGTDALSAGTPLTATNGDIVDTGGTVERPPPTPTEYAVNENFGDPHPHVAGETESRYHVRANLANGIMSADFMLRRMDVRGSEGEYHRSTLRGRDEFLAAVQHFQADDPNAIREIKGDWGQGDNLDGFNIAYADARRAGLSTEAALIQAAQATATGRWSVDAGFSHVRIESVTFGPAGLITHVDARFSR